MLLKDRAVPLLLLLMAVCLPTAAQEEANPADRAVPGKLVVEPPTLICLGFEWYGTGDANADASATVEFRKLGSEDWRRAMDLKRVHYDSTEGDVAPLLAGSIFELEPGTEYEVRLTMQDPDVSADEMAEAGGIRTIRTSTRAVPTTPEGGEVRHLYPPGHKGEEKEPSFHTLLGAARGLDRGSFGLNNRPTTLEPGDTVLVHAGVYKADRHAYRDRHFLIGFGTYHFPDMHGTPEKPITIKAAGNGEVVFDGDGAFRLFDLRGARNVIFEGITIRNCEFGFWLGDHPDKDWAEGITIRNCTFDGLHVGVMGRHPKGRHFLISDNRFMGQGGERAYQDISSNVAVLVGGQGHSICYNYAEFFFDFYDGGRNGEVTYSHDYVPGQDASIDIYNNHLHQMNDNAIGTGDRVHNIRVMRNLIRNNWQASLAPYGSLGGPVYWIRNVVHNNKRHVFKFHRPGTYAYHNTANTYDRSIPSHTAVVNSLYFSAPGKSKRPFPVPLTSLNDVHVDGNAYVMAPADEGFAKVRNETYATPEDFREATGKSMHSMIVTGDAVVEVPKEWTEGREFVAPEEFDMTPAQGSPLIDAAVPLPNINNDYAGHGPDIGAIERGQPAPHYGPRLAPPEPKKLSEPEGTPATGIPGDPGESVLRVNCGATLDYEAPNGVVWQADQALEGGATWGHVGNGGTATRRKQMQGTPLQKVYGRDRFRMEAYKFELSGGDYIVRLRFAEGWFDAAGRRVFDVTVNGDTALDDFDIYREAGGDHRAIHRDFDIEVGRKGLTISFEPVQDNPSINGIEIFRRED